MLLATLITLVGLNQNSEVIAMKAAGLSAHQVLAPLVLTAAVVSLVSFGFNERVVTRSTATLKAWQANDYGPVPADSGVRANVYLTDGPNILAAANVTGNGSAMVMRGVTFYVRSPDGMIADRITAPIGRYANPGWRLEDVRRFGVQGANSSSVARLVVGQGVTPQQIELAKVDPDTKSFTTLTDSIRRYEDAHRNADELRTTWWHKLSGPLVGQC